MRSVLPHRTAHVEVDRVLLDPIPIFFLESLHLLLPVIARNHHPLAYHKGLVSETIALGAAHHHADGRSLEEPLAFKQQLNPALIKQDEVMHRWLR